jgi:hypothetical protein
LKCRTACMHADAGERSERSDLVREGDVTN